MAVNPIAPAKYEVLNGFKQPGDSTNTDISFPIGKDTQFFLYGSADIGGTLISATKLLNVLKSTEVSSVSTASAIAISGYTSLVGGTGFACTLAAPEPGALCSIWMASITSGVVTIKTPAGVTFDGTNNTATFNAAADALTIGYFSSTQWQIVFNNSVTFSST